MSSKPHYNNSYPDRKTSVLAEADFSSAPNKKNDPAPNYTIQGLLTVATLALFLLIQNICGKVVFERVKNYKQEFHSRTKPLNPEVLMGERFGLDYLLPRHFVEIMKPQQVILLTPPVSYTKTFIKNSSAHCLLNPIYMFYMNDSVRTVRLDSEDYTKANCTVLIDKEGNCYPFKINSREDLDFAKNLFLNNSPYSPDK